MIIQQISLTNFRSYTDQTFDLNDHTTLIVGPNASGKTNLLEAIYVLATTKSFRARDRDLVRHETDFYRIAAVTPADEISLAYSTLETGSTTKQATRDGVKRSLVSHIGTLGVVLFEPDDLNLLSGPPEQRRRYLDSILCQADPKYLKTLTTYKRVLRQRNSLLEGFEPAQIRDQIFAWDVKLASLATEIYQRRQDLLAYLNQRIPEIYNEIAGASFDFNLTYQSSVPVTDYGTSFMEVLDKNLLRDLAAGFTTIGPHRDDFKVRFKNNDITALASRGEVRTAVLALKLAETSYLEEQMQVKPILLLDDVFSELDRSRRALLLSQLTEYQTIITTTDADHIKVDLPKGYKLISTGGVV